MLAQYQLDVLFPGFQPPGPFPVSNALWLFMLGTMALVAFAAGLEVQRNERQTRWTDVVACRLATVAAVLYITEAALTGAFWPYLEALNTLRNAGYLLFLAWCGLTGIIYLRKKL
ncbi:MAG: hypothetical protein U5K31_11625 [Balneolaceae bacterium]|nr:hypothetical protein [Balneolaceae bacterium]